MGDEHKKCKADARCRMRDCRRVWRLGGGPHGTGVRPSAFAKGYGATGRARQGMRDPRFGSRVQGTGCVRGEIPHAKDTRDGKDRRRTGRRAPRVLAYGHRANGPEVVHALRVGTTRAPGQAHFHRFPLKSTKVQRYSMEFKDFGPKKIKNYFTTKHTNHTKS
jgi:hypothetical protein